ncbi:MAG: FtsX-like permease family protein, partial [Gemmatimonadaceae bacterium]
MAIALNTTMYAMFDAMLNPRVAGGHPERVYNIRYYGDVRHLLDRDAVPEALATGQRTYDAVTGYRWWTGTVGIARGDRVRETSPLVVRPDFFSVLGVHAAQGAFIAAGDNEQQSIVISDRLAGELFPDARSITGSTVTLDGHASTVVAIARRSSGFSVLDNDVWVIASRANGEQVPVNLIRLREGVTRADADRELSTLAARLAAAAGESSRDTRFYLKSIVLEFTFWGFHYALIGGVVAVLLVACANLGNLQFARGLNRATEIAVRSAVGAAQRDIVLLLLTEVAVLATAGLILGLVLSYWGAALLRATIPESGGGFAVAPDVSWRMVGFAIGVTGLCVVIVGLIPAIRASRADLNALIKRGSGTGAHRQNRRKYGWLLIAQIGLTLPVVTVAVLMARTGWQMRDPLFEATHYYGFDPDSVIVAHVTIPARRNEFVHVGPIADRLIADARSVSGVSTAAVMLYAAPANSAVTISDSSGRIKEFETPMWTYRLVSPAYYRTMGLPTEQGADLIDGAYDVSSAIVDRSSATYFWEDGFHAGALIKFGDIRSTAPWLRVKGVRGSHLDRE